MRLGVQLIMNPENQRSSLTLFSNTHTSKLSRLTQFLISVENYGPNLNDVQEGYQREVGRSSSVSNSWIKQMEIMGLVSVDANSHIELRPKGDEVLNSLQGDNKPEIPITLIESFCETYTGFYDSIVLAAAVPLRVSQVKTILNKSYDLDWESKSQAKERVSWLRSLGITELNSATEYEITSEGEEVYNLLQKQYGAPRVQSLFVTDEEQITSEAMSAQTEEPEIKPVSSDSSVTLPFIERTDTKVISVHVPKTDGTDDRYFRTVESNVSPESDDPLFIEEYQSSAVRYWLCNSSDLDGVGGLTREDVVLFHHTDVGYMTVATVMEAKEVDIPISSLDAVVYFEEVHDTVVAEEELLDVFGWQTHPKGQWVRLDQKHDEVLQYEYNSVKEFIEQSRGELQFDYWSYENWSITGDFARHLDRQLERKGQIILYGPPGTGKTFMGEIFARWWTGKQAGTDPTTYQTESVTFHPAFSYEDFIEGYTITTDGEKSSNATTADTTKGDEGQSEMSNESPYGLKKGIFREFCIEASRALEATPEDRSPPRYVFVIDELNRGNVPQIFGEIITLLEKDKRGKDRFLSHSGEEFTIPENVFIIATMNTADQSISKLDAALRRRFAAISLTPDYGTLYDSHELFPEDREAAAEMVATGRKDTEAMVSASLLALEIINKRIVSVRGLGKGKRIGHAYLYPDTWMRDDESPRDLELTDVWRYEILPLLEEYFFEDPQQLDQRIFQGDAEFIDEATNDVLSLTPTSLKENLRTFVIDNQHELDIEISDE